jgi:hypothetical protein
MQRRIESDNPQTSIGGVMEDRWEKVAAMKRGLEAKANRAMASAQDVAMQASDLGKAAGEMVGEIVTDVTQLP